MDQIDQNLIKIRQTIEKLYTEMYLQPDEGPWATVAPLHCITPGVGK